MWAELIIAASVGAFLLLLLFQRECIEFSGVLETILLAFGGVIQGFARLCAVLPEIVLYSLDFPAPKSDAWQVAFSLAIFHQGRTLAIEWANKERRGPAVRALAVCAIFGASVSYCFGMIVSEPKPVLTSLFIALLYGLLEFVRYTLLSLELRRDVAHGFYHEFRRRQLLYTFPYTLIGVLSALTSWAILGTSPALLPFFAIMFFSGIGFYILAVEVYFQVRQARGTYSGVPFFESTRTQTVLVLLTSCALCLVLVYKESPVELLLFTLKNCRAVVQ